MSRTRISQDRFGRYVHSRSCSLQFHSSIMSFLRAMSFTPATFISFHLVTQQGNHGPMRRTTWYVVQCHPAPARTGRGSARASEVSSWSTSHLARSSSLWQRPLTLIILPRGSTPASKSHSCHFSFHADITHFLTAACKSEQWPAHRMSHR